MLGDFLQKHKSWIIVVVIAIIGTIVLPVVLTYNKKSFTNNYL